jgi:hypothetical protein
MTSQAHNKRLSGRHRTLSGIFAFLGLCPFDIPEELIPSSETSFQKRRKFREDSAIISEGTIKKLEEFFSPFRRELEELLGRPIS